METFYVLETKKNICEASCNKYIMKFLQYCVFFFIDAYNYGALSYLSMVELILLSLVHILYKGYIHGIQTKFSFPCQENGLRLSMIDF